MHCDSCYGKRQQKSVEYVLVQYAFGTELDLPCVTENNRFLVLIVFSPWQSRRAAAMSEGLRMSVRLMLNLFKIIYCKQIYEMQLHLTTNCFFYVLRNTG